MNIGAVLAERSVGFTNRRTDKAKITVFQVKTREPKECVERLEDTIYELHLYNLLTSNDNFLSSVIVSG